MELLRGRPLRSIAKRYKVGASSVFRHVKRCLAERLRREQVLSTEALLEQLDLLINETVLALKDAKIAKSLPGRAALLAQLAKNCELLAKLGAGFRTAAEQVRGEVDVEEVRERAVEAIQKALGLDSDVLIERVEDEPFIPPDVEPPAKPAAPATVESEIVRPQPQPQRALPPAPGPLSGTVSVPAKSLLGENFMRKVL